jgi:DNA polymerase-3 subunit gamma/tau
MDRGREPLIVLQNLANVYRDLLIAKTASDRSDLVAMTSSGWDRLSQLAQSLAIPNILLGQQHLRSAELQIRNSNQPRLWLEVTLMGLLPSAQNAIAQSQSPHPSQPQPYIPPRNISATPQFTPQAAKSNPASQVPSTASQPPIAKASDISLNSIPSLPIIETPISSGSDDFENMTVIPFSAKVEEELLDLTDEEAKSFLEELGASDTGLNRLIQTAYKMLQLVTFLTSGEMESRASRQVFQLHSIV